MRAYAVSPFCIAALLVFAAGCRVFWAKGDLYDTASAPKAGTFPASTRIGLRTNKARGATISTSTIFQILDVRRGFEEALKTDRYIIQQATGPYELDMQFESSSGFPAYRTVLACLTGFIIPQYEWKHFILTASVKRRDGSPLRNYQYEFHVSEHFGWLVGIGHLLISPFTDSYSTTKPDYKRIGRALYTYLARDLAKDSVAGLYTETAVDGELQIPALRGTCGSGSCVDGFGIMRTHLGFFVGEFRQGLPHGPGTLMSSDYRFSGSWQYGKANGPARVECANGFSFAAQFSGGWPVGNIDVTKDGRKWELGVASHVSRSQNLSPLCDAIRMFDTGR